MPEAQSTFYNVMPEAKGIKGAKPSMSKVNAAKADVVFGTTASTDASSSIKMHKAGFIGRILANKMVLIPLVVIILGGLIVGGFVLYDTMQSSAPAEEAIVENNTTPQTPVDVDVTTPPSWLAQFFGAETCTIKTTCADASDPDKDGLSNKEEFELGADPNNPDGDSDGISDGDEHHVFNSSPLMSRTYRDGEYNDSDFVKGGYDIGSNNPYTADQLLNIKAKIKDLGLHQPTLTTIGTLALSLYEFVDPSGDTLSKLNIDQSPQAKLDRDTQRQSTIKKIGSALIKHLNGKKSYPVTNDFVVMNDAIASFNTVATNYNDPINQDQYVYAYQSDAKGLDFTLTYYSETQNQLIKYTAKNAQEAAKKEEALVKDQQRIADLENIKSALVVYSSTMVDSNSDQIYSFPTKDQYQTVLVENRLITALPKDPNGSAYIYEPNATLDSFVLKAVLEVPSQGKTGYTCGPEICKEF